MGQNTILNKNQQVVLTKISQDDFLCDTFYFTGGTALSEVYLQHRNSVDLDFFTTLKYDAQKITSRLENWADELHFSIKSRYTEPVNIYDLKFETGETLKVDFAHYPYKQLQEPTLYADKLKVDSMFDIATNKLMTITQRMEVKDFVDLYFLLQEFTFWDLKAAVKVKFNIDIEPYIMAADFMVVDDFEYLPNMIKPLDLATLQEFYKTQAIKLGKTVMEE